jgi:hypothetical protein
MTTPETLNTKVSVNELRFPLVTHTVYSNARFESYRTLKSEQGAEDSIDRLDRPEHDQVLRAEDA